MAIGRVHAIVAPRDMSRAGAIFSARAGAAGDWETVTLNRSITSAPTAVTRLAAMRMASVPFAPRAGRSAVKVKPRPSTPPSVLMP